MNSIFLSLGLENWKPALSALLLPPVPLLLLVLVGARLMFTRRLLAWVLVLLGCTGLYLMSTHGLATLLTQWLTRPPPALTTAQVAELKKSPRTAIVVLGSGRREYAPEYGMSTLNNRSTERLRYGLWLSRETGLPVAFTGGVGHGAREGPTEAEVAARVADREFGRPLKWIESESRDTRENALRTVPLLQAAGIERIVLVSNDYHLRRALRNFERAIGDRKISLVAAPLGQPRSPRPSAIDWLPSLSAFDRNWLALHEWLGYLSGA